MDIEAECFSTHLIDGDGTFNGVGLDNFIKQIKLGKCGLSYAVVAIMGPQSSGKSTLLNHLFYTNFKEMNAYMGRSQTTKGIWIARCPDIEPCTIVMDLEGTNGRERGEDDTAFEKQSALFALSVSDIVLINMWCHEIGLVQAAYKPLLKTAFQVMMHVFSPRKTTLMFVIRDKMSTPVELLEIDLRDDIQKIWDSIPKPEAHKHTRLSEFFNVHIVALSSCEKEEQFKQEVASLRQKFFQSIAPGGLAGDRRGVVPASGFSFSAEQIWKVIKENKDLDLQSHKVMVATERCEEIAKEEYSFFLANEGWLELEEAVQSRLVPGFGKKLSSLLYNCLSSYDEETIYFEDNIRSAKREQLEEQLKQLVQPAYHLMLERIQAGAIDNFKKALCHALAEGQGFAVAARDCTNKFLKIFDGQLEGAVIYQANWDLDKVRDKFAREIISYISEVQSAILSELTTVYKSKLKEAFYVPLEALLRGGHDDTWPAIRKLLHDETETAVSEFSFALSGFEMGDQSNEDMISLLKNYSRGIIVQKTREETKRVSYHMKERFTSIFNYDNGSMPRVWTGKEEIRAISISARLSSIKLLSVFAAIRLDGDTDTIEDTLALRLFGPYKGTLKTSHDPLASKTWKEVGATNTVISPVDCNLLWNQFLSETEDTITQALASQETKKRKISSCYITPQISTTAGAATSSSSCAMSPIMDAIRATKVPTKKRSNRSWSESIASLMTPNSICSFLQFPNNIKGERRWKYQEKLAALRSREIEPARTIDWEILEQFNLADEIRGFLGIEYTNGEVDIKSSEWVNLFSIVEPIYRELCLEFFSTYQFNEKSRAYTDDKALTFRLGGLDRHCSVKEFGVRMGLYPQALADNPNFLHFLKSGAVAPAMDFDYEGFWSKIAKGSYNINLPLKESDIRHPVHRILHRMLSYSITARKKTNGVTKMDLWYLSSFLNKDKHLNAAHCLASYLTEPVGRFKTRVIYGGHFVTRLAKSYPFFTDAFRLRLTQAQPMTLIDHASLIRMNILPKDVRSGVLTLCDQLDLEDSEDEGLDEEAPPAHERDPTMPDIEVRVAHMENDIAIMKGTLDLDSEDERLEENEDEEAPPTHERNPTMPDIGVRVANMERDIANINGTVDWLQRSMIRVLNHLRMPPEPPDNEAGPSTIQHISLSDVD